MYIVAGSKKGHSLVVPKGNITRPTASALREAVFNICQTYIEDARFLDLFAGSGAIGFEALSRGAKSCTFVDSNKESVVAIKKNVQALEFSAVSSVVHGDVFAFLKSFARKGIPFDIIFVDPPYSEEAAHDQTILSYSDRVIDIIDNSLILAPGGFLFIEDIGRKESLPKSLSSLTLVSSRRAGRATLNQYQKVVL